MTEVSDEMLMAFADGELDPESAGDVARAVGADPALARRVEAFRASRVLARDSLAVQLGEPVPDHLVAAIMKPANTGRGQGRTRTLLPLAATLALAAGLGGYMLGGRDSAQGLLTADPAVSAALERSLTGETVDLDGRTAKVLATFRTKAGICRSFSLSGDGPVPVRGLGCRSGQGWRIAMAVADAGGDGFSPAAGAAGLDALLDELEAEGPLDASAEQEIKTSGWE
jgi:hypothetical protein